MFGNEGILDATAKVLALTRVDTVVEVPTEALITLTRAATFDPPMASLERVLGSGRLPLLGDASLQQSLAAWPAAVADLDDKSRLHEVFIYDQLVPEMRSIMPFRILADTRASDCCWKRGDGSVAPSALDRHLGPQQNREPVERVDKVVM